jgi:hypothetical protein
MQEPEVAFFTAIIQKLVVNDLCAHSNKGNKSEKEREMLLNVDFMRVCL